MGGGEHKRNKGETKEDRRTTSGGTSRARAGAAEEQRRNSRAGAAEPQLSNTSGTSGGSAEVQRRNRGGTAEEQRRNSDGTEKEREEKLNGAALKEGLAVGILMTIQLLLNIGASEELLGWRDSGLHQTLVRRRSEALRDASGSTKQSARRHLYVLIQIPFRTVLLKSWQRQGNDCRYRE